RLHAVSSQPQEPSNLAEFESQTLYAADKSQCLNVVLAVLTEAPLCSWGARQQGVALVETNRVNAQTDLLRDGADLHDPGSYLKATPWSIVQSQALLSDHSAYPLMALSFSTRMRVTHFRDALSPLFAGFLFSHHALIDIPFFIAGTLKIAYDLVLYLEFRRSGHRKRPINGRFMSVRGKSRPVTGKGCGHRRPDRVVSSGQRT